MKLQRFLFCIFLFVLGALKAQAQGITISGTVYDDGTESAALGVPTNMVGTKPLYANLSYRNIYDSFGSFYVQASVPVSVDGTYSFTNVISISDPTMYRFFNYRVSLSIELGVVNSVRPSPILPNAINEGASDVHYQSDFGLDQNVIIGTTDLINVNFSFNQYPNANSIIALSQPNPDDEITQIIVPMLTGSDPEDGTYNGINAANKVAITGFPSNGTLFYNNKPLEVSQSYNCVPACSYSYIQNYNPSLLAVVPIKGNKTISFQYSIADAAGRWSASSATVVMPFTSSLDSYDYGDAANSYQTSDPAHHRLVSGLRIGQLIDSETAPFRSFYAQGDDTNNVDDEDGVISFAPLSTTNTSYSVTVSVLNSLSKDATLSGWIDFNNNGTFESEERAQTTVSSNTINTDVVLTWSNLTNISAIGVQDIGLYARFRLASDASEVATPNGLATSGEVEDYNIPVTGLTISGTIFSDANGLTDNTVNGTPIYGRPLFISVYNTQYVRVLGYTYSEPYKIDGLSPGTYRVEVTGYDYSTHMPLPYTPANYYSGENIGNGLGSDGTPDGRITVVLGESSVENVNFGINFAPYSSSITSIHTASSGTTQVHVPTLTGSDSEDALGGYDINAIKLIIQILPAHGTLYYDGTPITAGQHITSQFTRKELRQPFAAYDPTKLTVDPDGSLPVEFTYSVVDAAGLISTPSTVKMTFRGTGTQFDFGDAPYTYKTLITDNGPLHTLTDGLQLGNLIDAETNGQFNGNQFETSATGDNVNGLNDEDGVTSFPIIPGGAIPKNISSYSVLVNVTNTTPGPAYLSGWIDWNNDGLFNDAEIAQATVPAGTNGAITLTWTNQTLTGPARTTNTYARFRLSTDQNAVSSPLGDAPDGEVEDYSVPFASALPVEFTRFEGKWIEGKGNQLSWGTAWEQNNDRFEIQSSRDARSFESIGRVAGKGTTADGQSYTFIDAQPQADLTYYRLKQVDKAGSFTYSRIIAIQQAVNQVDATLLVYPNPVSDQLNLQLSGQQTPTEVSIYTIGGQRLLSQPVSGASVNVKLLPSGIYVVELRTNTGQLLRQRFIKQ